MDKNEPPAIRERLLRLLPTLELMPETCADILVAREFTGTGYVVYIPTATMREDLEIVTQMLETRTTGDGPRFFLGHDGRVIGIDVYDPENPVTVIPAS